MTKPHYIPGFLKNKSTLSHPFLRNVCFKCVCYINKKSTCNAPYTKSSLFDYAKSLFSLKYLQPGSAASDAHLPVHNKEGVAAVHVFFVTCGGSVGENHPLSLQQ